MFQYTLNLYKKYHFFSGYVITDPSQMSILEVLAYILEPHNRCSAKVLSFKIKSQQKINDLRAGDLIIVKAELVNSVDKKFFVLIDYEKLELVI
ncbi:hypothetical protein OF376_00150 [Ureaplasma miroungigenitalium]|uniref:Uncharacterized protein n=1 Tax=Ureaplasma miroungigenitalium TaxID=1042321 RepID=A0ABT3BLQ3_9BACT|nr:hypothetical protein [Ureaplasma miroungigenitalium]MCV3728201.1 hypothetical protein [Ureaplasma miroungigenitalium]MCV3734005.1 hypothetical protein [Ureaplasma miroungigenitalium]